MEIRRPGTEIKGFLRPRLPTPAKAFARSRRRHPTISGPIGPIKNSRGPDFTRSDTFIIVPGIKDCGSGESLPDNQTSAAKKATRRISASFSTQGPLASSPTVAKSDFNATTTYRAPMATKKSKQFRKISASSLASSPKSLLTSSSTVDFLPRLDGMSQDENIPPSMSESSPPSTFSHYERLTRPKDVNLETIADVAFCELP
ncbi:Fc.00g044040.m01.CDS01 [Cosmosporella sp. VM-42]